MNGIELIPAIGSFSISAGIALTERRASIAFFDVDLRCPLYFRYYLVCAAFLIMPREGRPKAYDEGEQSARSNGRGAD